MLLSLRHPRLWLVLGWLLVLGSIAVSLLPGQSLPAMGLINDKIEHGIAYTVLSLWFAGIYPRSRYVVIAIGLLLMGIGIEWAQGAMGVGRQSDFRDVIANAVGITAGLGVALFWLGGWAQRVESWTRR